MQEPESGYLLCGETGDQQLYERDDDAGAALAAASATHTPEYRWFHVADGTDVYRFTDLITDYGTVVHLTVCKERWHGQCCDPETTTP